MLSMRSNFTLVASTLAVVALPSTPLASLDAQTPSARKTASMSNDQYMERALRVLQASPVMDGHNDLPWRIREDGAHPGDVNAYDLHKRTPGMTDLARLKQGHVGAQFWSIYIPGEPTDAAGWARKGEVYREALSLILSARPS